MHKGLVDRLRELLPKKNIAFSSCSCNNPSHTVHAEVIKKKRSIATV